MNANLGPLLRVSDEPLWGRSVVILVAVVGLGDEFQTNPCGVEAREIESGSIPSGRFQTNPCGVEAFPSGCVASRAIRRFRRTLVGSKRLPLCDLADALVRFQTNPCGVEAEPSASPSRSSMAFQTNPCGVEARTCCLRSPIYTRFQTNPCGVEATAALRFG
ncbi:hypothetical protein NJ7G_3319 [Natrinema sp. J7-2]|nr:hypothetical protein NJ7G_3319 [Natrinema sp. J7-2]